MEIHMVVQSIAVTLLVLLALLMTTFLLEKVIWLFNPLFFFFNRLQWFLYSPLRFKNLNSKWPRRIYKFFLFIPVIPVWWLTIHILLTPIRLINAVYFDILLSWTLIMKDGLLEFFHPQLGSYRRQKGFVYLLHWIFAFPWRLVVLLYKNGLAILEGIVMAGFDTVWPTLTMYHGTSFERVATDIAQKGRWYVGSGDFAGSGIYFGMERRVAEHYASSTVTSESSKAIVISRVTLSSYKSAATLPDALKQHFGGGGGEKISKGLKFPYASIEHWRDDKWARWFEYCIVQPGKSGEFVTTWRARPIAVLKEGKPTRIWGGRSLRTGVGGYLLIIVTWILIIALLALAVGGHFH